MAASSTDHGADATPPADRVFGWGHAALVALAVLVAAAILLVVVPNVLVTKLDGVSRSTRVAAATTWFTLAVVGFAWALRRLQAHHVV